jgi:glycopeptide antibiotics resistance protein
MAISVTATLILADYLAYTIEFCVFVVTKSVGALQTTTTNRLLIRWFEYCNTTMRGIVQKVSSSSAIGRQQWSESGTITQRIFNSAHTTKKQNAFQQNETHFNPLLTKSHNLLSVAFTPGL